MTLRANLFASRSFKLVALAVLAAGAVALAGMVGTQAAHADEPPGPQQIVVGQLSITTNSQWYAVGQHITVCYKVPQPGYIEITDHQGGQVKLLLAGHDDGTGDCFGGYVTPPTGLECLQIRFYFWQGGSTTKHTCFHVYYPI
jgi:hypothetical protein